MEQEQLISEWKLITRRLWLWLRLIFLLVITWDFFLTVVIQTSQRSLTLLGIGSALSSVVIVPWILSILGISLLMLTLIGKKGKDNIRYTGIAYMLLGCTTFVYSSLTFLAIINAVAWPVIMCYGVMVLWSVVLMYFRNRMVYLESLE